MPRAACIFWRRISSPPDLRMMTPLRRLLTRVGAAAVLVAAVSEVHAHTAAKEVGDFYAGFLHPLTALEHVLSFVALGLLIGQQGHKASAAVLATNASTLSRP